MEGDRRLDTAVGFSASSEKMAGKEAIWFLQQQVD